MQKVISRQKIKRKLNLLNIKLPKHLIAIDGLYSLPAELANEVTRSNFSQDSIQKISDHMGYFLGILKSVKITFIEEPTDTRWVGTKDGTIVREIRDKNTSPVSGLYKVIGPDSSEILLIKKQRYRLKHILAILAHEYTHNYLYHHGIRESVESENEILTEICAAYLGLGYLLIRGYEPITWVSDQWDNGFASGHTKHILSLGYVTQSTIRSAIIMSAELRNWDPKEVIANFSSQWDRIIAYFQLRQYGNRIKKIKREKSKATILLKKREEQVVSLKMKINEIQKMYSQICELIKSISINTDPSLITAEDGRMFVEIANKVYAGEMEFEIQSISEKISDRKALWIANEKFTRLVMKVSELKDIISKWYKVLRKYNNGSNTILASSV